MRAFAAALLLAGSAAAADETIASTNLHFQATIATQAHPRFSAAYSGKNSMQTDAESATSIVTDLYAGVRLWRGGEFYFQPEASPRSPAARCTASAIRSRPSCPRASSTVTP
jgi:high affinity Mn2+ porin